MKIRALALACLAGLALPTVAQAQNRLILINTQDLSTICNSSNAFFIGNNPASIELVGSRLFVGGFNNSGVATNNYFTVIGNIFGTRTFLRPAGGVISMPNSRGFTGMDYMEGQGLLMTYDAGSFGTANQVRLWDIDTQVNPILLKSSPASFSPRGGSGPAWDAGFDGLGFNDGTTVRPVPSVFDGNTSSGGGSGLNPALLSGDSFDLLFFPGGGSITISGAPLRGTFWRDADIHPKNGTIVARAADDVVIATRNGANNVLGTRTIVTGGLDASGNVPQTIGQNVVIMDGFPGGDVIAYNNRPITTSGQPFSGSVKFINMNGTARTMTFENLDGSAVTFPAGNNYYSFSWDSKNQRLAIADFTNRVAWIFIANCPADYDATGFVDSDDFVAFVSDFAEGCTAAGTPGAANPNYTCLANADFDRSGFVDSDDFVAFVAAFSNGCF